MNWIVIDNASQIINIKSNGIDPLSIFPGRSESLDVGKPNQYLFGPDLVITHETANVDNVDSNNTTGNDPAKGRKVI